MVLTLVVMSAAEEGAGSDVHSAQHLAGLSKKDLMVVAKDHDIQVSPRKNKAELLEAVTKGLAERGKLDLNVSREGLASAGSIRGSGPWAGGGQTVTTAGAPSSPGGLGEAIRLKELDLEMKRLEVEAEVAKWRTEELRLQIEVKRNPLQPLMSSGGPNYVMTPCLGWGER